MDIFAYIKALNASKTYTDEKVYAFTKGLNYLGTVATIDDLPLSGNALGDMYIISASKISYVWSVDSDTGTKDNWQQYGSLDPRNYYTKDELYNKEQIDEIIDHIERLVFVKVDSLPDAGKEDIIYLKPSEDPTTTNRYEEWIWVDGIWERIGAGQNGDLSDYAKKEWVQTNYQPLIDKDKNPLPAENISGLARVALTGSYNDLIDKPVGPVISEEKHTVLTKANYSDPDATELAKIAEPANADIAIIKAPIANGEYEYTAYVYDTDNGWMAMDGNYSADNVYFQNDLIYTANIGVKTVPSSGSGTIEAKGKNLKTVLSSILAEEKKGTITQPSVSVSSTVTGGYEVGTTVTPNFTATLNAGSYQYGPATEITANSWSVTDTSGHSTASSSGSFDSFVVNDSTSYSITAKANYGDGAWAKTNLGNQPTAGDLAQRINAGSKQATTSKITGFRYSFWYVGTDATATTTGAQIRTFSSKQSGTKLTYSLAIAKGTKRVTIAVPDSHTLKSVIDVDGMGLDVKENFSKTTISVDGAIPNTGKNYSVFEFINENGVEKTTYNVTIQ